MGFEIKCDTDQLSTIDRATIQKMKVNPRRIATSRMRPDGGQKHDKTHDCDRPKGPKSTKNNRKPKLCAHGTIVMRRRTKRQPLSWATGERRSGRSRLESFARNLTFPA